MINTYAENFIVFNTLIDDMKDLNAFNQNSYTNVNVQQAQEFELACGNIIDRLTALKHCCITSYCAEGMSEEELK